MFPETLLTLISTFEKSGGCCASAMPGASNRAAANHIFRVIGVLTPVKWRKLTTETDLIVSSLDATQYRCVPSVSLLCARCGELFVLGGACPISVLSVVCPAARSLTLNSQLQTGILIT